MELGEAGGDCHLIGSILDMLICPFVLNYNCYLLPIHVLLFIMKTLSIISYALPRVLVVGPPDDGSSSNSKPSTEFELLGGRGSCSSPSRSPRSAACSSSSSCGRGNAGSSSISNSSPDSVSCSSNRSSATSLAVYLDIIIIDAVA